MSPNRTLELLAPAGDWPHLQAALQSGADAIYFGVDGWNMRAGARNFGLQDLSQVVSVAHEQGARAYLALNTLCYEDELDALEGLLDRVRAAAVDAVIAADLAVIELCLQRGIPVHISTQMSVSNSQSILFLYKRGIRRFVLARECSLEDIATIRQNLKNKLGERADEIELEAFAHGAMCVSVSGRCFMSAHLTGKSANRGECTQPCRREYTLVDERGEARFRLNKGHLLSPKDLCTLPFLEKLVDAGIHSFKIEGRNRSADYVRTVIDVYRRTLDHLIRHRHRLDFEQSYTALKTVGLSRLQSVYNRGFSEGFYFGKPMSDWNTAPGNQASQRRVYVGKVMHYYPKVGVAEVLLEADSLELGNDIFFEGKQTGVVEQTLESLEIEHCPQQTVPKGERVGIRTAEIVRVGDKLYKRERIDTTQTV